MPGLRRYLDILHLFTDEQPGWTVAAMAAALDTPASTVYRAVRELLAGALLEQGREAHYRLGAAFVEFDRRLRRTDVLIRRADSLLQEVAAEAALPCAVVLARLYGSTVMCVADARHGAQEGAREGEGAIPTSYERGRPQPLFRGATSKVILAQLSPRRLTRLLDGEAHPAQLRRELAATRRRGYAVTRGEVDRGLAGIAAPVTCPEEAIIASLSLVVQEAALTEAPERRLVELATGAAAALTARLKTSEP